MSDSKSQAGGASIDKFVIGLWKITKFLFGPVELGFRAVKWKSVDCALLTGSIALLLFSVTFAKFAYLKVLHWILPGIFTTRFVTWLKHIHPIWHFLVLIIVVFGSILFWLGLSPYLKRRRFQRDLDVMGLANAKHEAPWVSKIIEIDDNRTKVLVSAKGVGVDKFEGKRSDLESSFGQMVEKISASQDRKRIEILLCRKELIKMFPYEEAITHLKKPYSFIVGESIDGVIVQELPELPHLLIAGSTGGGKSVFFRQCLLGLLESSPHLQLYLIDLKRGVEVKEFAQLPNVRIAKDENEAVRVLEAVKNEMQKRFEFMEKIGAKKIEPSKHKLDLIVVGIDEASVLFGKTSVSSEKKEIVALARDLTDEIAKLARAAGIHLIIATQKAIKESLDTKTLENLPGRMAFKMTTHAGSNTALGNVRAYSLPDIKGRGIWAGGNKFLEVQAPFLSESDVDEKCKNLADEYLRSGKQNFQPMIEWNSDKSEKVSAFMQAENLVGA